MGEHSEQRAAVIGTGMMGPRIAMTIALGGIPVTLIGRNSERTSTAAAGIAADMATLVEHELIDPDEREAALGLLAHTTDLDAGVRDADIVIESIVEHMPTKHDLFAHLDRVCPPETILTSNTSALPVSGFADAVRRKERVAVTHYWNPPHLIPLVEIVRGAQTSDDTIERLRDLMIRTDKDPVIMQRDMPGFLANRLQHALTREALYLVQEGVVSAEDLDRVVSSSFGLRFPTWGPLLHSDAVGLDLVLAVETGLLPHLDRTAEPPRILRELVEKGDLGRKTGKGLFDWSDRDFDALLRRRDEDLLWRAKQRRAARRSRDTPRG